MRHVQYGDVAVRRRWFFISVISMFCFVVVLWFIFMVWRGSPGVGAGAGITNIRTAWESLIAPMRDAFNK